MTDAYFRRVEKAHLEPRAQDMIPILSGSECIEYSQFNLMRGQVIGQVEAIQLSVLLVLGNTALGQSREFKEVLNGSHQMFSFHQMIEQMHLYLS